MVNPIDTQYKYCLGYNFRFISGFSFGIVYNFSLDSEDTFVLVVSFLFRTTFIWAITLSTISHLNSINFTHERHKIPTALEVSIGLPIQKSDIINAL